MLDSLRLMDAVVIEFTGNSLLDIARFPIVSTIQALPTPIPTALECTANPNPNAGPVDAQCSFYGPQGNAGCNRVGERPTEVITM
jgi:hypothetical protein